MLSGGSLCLYYLRDTFDEKIDTGEVANGFELLLQK